jgi:hypothetical protein
MQPSAGQRRRRARKEDPWTPSPPPHTHLLLPLPRHHMWPAATRPCNPRPTRGRKGSGPQAPRRQRAPHAQAICRRHQVSAAGRAPARRGSGLVWSSPLGLEPGGLEEAAPPRRPADAAAARTAGRRPSTALPVLAARTRRGSIVRPPCARGLSFVSPRPHPNRLFTWAPFPSLSQEPAH